MAWEPVGLAGATAALIDLAGTITTDGSAQIVSGLVFVNDVLQPSLAASEPWQGAPCDMTSGGESGPTSGYAAFAAQLMTDVPGAYLAVEVSATGIRWADAEDALQVVAANVSTTLSSAMASTGLTSVPMTSVAGFLPGDTIIVGALTANVETLTVDTDGVGASTLTTTTGSLHTHLIGASVDRLPYLATVQIPASGFRYARCRGVNGSVATTVCNIASIAKASV